MSSPSPSESCSNVCPSCSFLRDDGTDLGFDASLYMNKLTFSFEQWLLVADKYGVSRADKLALDLKDQRADMSRWLSYGFGRLRAVSRPPSSVSSNTSGSSVRSSAVESVEKKKNKYKVEKQKKNVFLSRQLSGFCYSGMMVKSSEAMQVVESLGKWPKLDQLLRAPASSFKSVADLDRMSASVVGGNCHVLPAAGGQLLMPLLRKVAVSGSYYPGSVGAAVAASGVEVSGDLTGDTQVGGKFRYTGMVLCDVPDPDNFEAVATAVKKHRAPGVIAVVLACTRSDFSVASYPDLMPGKDVRDSLAPISTAGLKPQFGQWDFVDKGMGDCDAIEDTRIAMSVSVVMLVEYLSSLGISSDRYDVFYSDPSYSRVCVGLRHAGHRPYWASGLSEADRAAFLKCRAEGPPVSAVRRTLIRAMLLKYVRSARLTNVYPFRDLLDEVRLTKPKLSRVVVGGPFTEFRELFEAGLNVDNVFAMAFSTDQSLNVFSNQFNVLLDFDSALWAVAQCQKGFFKMYCVTTDVCVFNPIDLDPSSTSEATMRLNRRWKGTSGVVPFDVLPVFHKLVVKHSVCAKISLVDGFYSIVPSDKDNGLFLMKTVDVKSVLGNWFKNL